MSDEFKTHILPTLVKREYLGDGLYVASEPSYRGVWLYLDAQEDVNPIFIEYEVYEALTNYVKKLNE
jgi:hypothetical protein